MNCENITITDASSDDLRYILDLLSVVQLPTMQSRKTSPIFSLPTNRHAVLDVSQSVTVVTRCDSV